MSHSLIRPPRPSDAEALFPLIFQSSVTETIGWDGPISLAEYKDSWQALVDRATAGQRTFFTIVEPDSALPIGSCDLRPDAEHLRAELGLWLGSPFQGKGLGTRVIGALVEHGFSVLGLNKVDARVFVGNSQSRRAFEKNGFRLEGTLRSAGRKRGKIFDDWLLGKVRAEQVATRSESTPAAGAGLEFNALVPELLVSDLERSLQFYVDQVGFRAEYRRSQPDFAYLSFGESQLMLERDSWQPAWQVEPLDAPRGRGLNLSIRCLDARDLAERLLGAGIRLRLPPEDRWYRCGEVTLGERHFLVQDPDGYLLRFAEDLGARV